MPLERVDAEGCLGVASDVGPGQPRDRAQDTATRSHLAGDLPYLRLSLWPYRSLPKVGFVWFIGITCAMIGVPLLAFLGSPVLWGLLPFVVAVVAGLWSALTRSYRDGELLEELSLWSDRIELVRHNPRGPRQRWIANPHWVSIQMFETGGPVPNYLTLRGAGREVEIGAFLTPEERVGLRSELAKALAFVR